MLLHSILCNIVVVQGFLRFKSAHMPRHFQKLQRFDRKAWRSEVIGHEESFLDCTRGYQKRCFTSENS